MEKSVPSSKDKGEREKKAEEIEAKKLTPTKESTGESKHLESLEKVGTSKTESKVTDTMEVSEEIKPFKIPRKVETSKTESKVIEEVSGKTEPFKSQKRLGKLDVAKFKAKPCRYKNLDPSLNPIYQWKELRPSSDDAKGATGVREDPRERLFRFIKDAFELSLEECKRQLAKETEIPTSDIVMTEEKTHDPSSDQSTSKCTTQDPGAIEAAAPEARDKTLEVACCSKDE